MIKFLADENFNNQIVRGVLQQNPDIDLVRVQDVGLKGASDPDVLFWAAQEKRIQELEIEPTDISPEHRLLLPENVKDNLQEQCDRLSPIEQQALQSFSGD